MGDTQMIIYLWRKDNKKPAEIDHFSLVLQIREIQCHLVATFGILGACIDCCRRNQKMGPTLRVIASSNAWPCIGVIQRSFEGVHEKTWSDVGQSSGNPSQLSSHRHISSNWTRSASLSTFLPALVLRRLRRRSLHD